MTKGWNEVVWNEVVMERSDRNSAVSEFVVAFAMKIMKVPRCDKLPSLFSKGILF